MKPGFLFLLLSLTSGALPAQVRLRPYRQAQVSFASPPVNLTWGGRDARATDGAHWKGTAQGLWREDSQAEPLDRRRYFGGRRWLPDDEVQSLAPAAQGAMWVKTKTGTARIEFPSMRLIDKAAVFERRIADRHLRHGFVANTSLTEPGNLASSHTRTDDNDGLWTAMYLAAEAYRFQATKSPEARRLAERSLEAILELERITGRPGLPARSYVLPNEAMPNEGVWFTSPVRPEVTWKGDTSSDEIVGHYYGFAVAFDRLPASPLRDRMVATARRITDHILEHNLTLTEIHGMPTWWGRWDKEYFASRRGKPDSPLNAIEILSFLKTAHHLTGDARYERQYLRLAREEGYARIGAQLLELRGATVNYSDEELALLSYYPLLQYEKDPSLLAIYRDGLNQWWRNMEREKNPLWNAIYLACQPAPPPNQVALVQDARWTLERIPMDLIDWNVANAHRTDVEWEPVADRFNRRQAKTLLPPDERPIMRWNGNPFRADGGSGGRREEDGVFFLLPLWMNIAHGYFRP